MHARLWLLLISLLSSSCLLATKNIRNSRDTAFLPCLTRANDQLAEAFSLMEKHYYKREETKWDSLKIIAREKLLRSSNCEEALQTVNWCFSQMGETHSFIMPAAKAAVYNNDQTQLKAPPSLWQVMGELKSALYEDKGIAYLSVPWVNTADSALCTLVADSIQQVIAELDRPGITKWIIDLRNNRGGNCWPMLAGIGPLLGDGVCGYFVSGNDKVPISYRQGAAMHGRYTRCKVSKAPYVIRNPKSWIVVLTGASTSSSGEIVALAFKGKNQTLLYGQPTAGLTTANTTYNLSDRSMLVLTVCKEADRHGRMIEGKIIPDELIALPAEGETDDLALNAAVMWLHIQ